MWSSTPTVVHRGPESKESTSLKLRIRTRNVSFILLICEVADTVSEPGTVSQTKASSSRGRTGLFKIGKGSLIIESMLLGTVSFCSTMSYVHCFSIGNFNLTRISGCRSFTTSNMPLATKVPICTSFFITPLVGIPIAIRPVRQLVWGYRSLRLISIRIKFDLLQCRSLPNIRLFSTSYENDCVAPEKYLVWAI